MRHRKQRWSRAFTLIELMLTVALIAVSATIAMPRYARAVARYQADAAARRVVADLAVAQAQARLTSSTVTVTFSPSSNQYTIPNMPDPGIPGSSSYTVTFGSNQYAASLVSASFGGGPSVSFDGYGAPSSGGTVVVQAGSATNTITLNADTGTASY